MIDTEKMREKWVPRVIREGTNPGEYAEAVITFAIEALCREVEHLRRRRQEIDDEAFEYSELVEELRWDKEALYLKLYGSGGLEEVEAEPDWLPSPGKLPEELAPAQMVEWFFLNKEIIYQTTADQLPQGYVHPVRYRPLYADSGEVICSADGLEEWAQFVATDGDGQVWQYECVPEEDDGLWEQVMGSANPAPSTHRKPGPWIESLMEVTRR